MTLFGYPLAHENDAARGARGAVNTTGFARIQPLVLAIEDLHWAAGDVVGADVAQARSSST